MIELKVEEYCSECPDFKEHVTRSGGCWFGGDCRGELEPRITITCKHSDRCKILIGYLAKKMEERAQDPFESVDW